MLNNKIFDDLSGESQRHKNLSSESFSSLSTDTRKIKKNDIFLALSGENFDGFDYLEVALKQGASGVIFECLESRKSQVEELIKAYPDADFIEVKDSLSALQEIALRHRNSWYLKSPNKKIIGITGSNGKTTHKEMLFRLLDFVMPGKVHYTKGNLNNHIGVPLTLLELEDNHEVAIIEMGMNHAGEISDLCQIALPDAGIITNIGDAHIEFFGSREAIFEEKSQLFHAVNQYTDGKGEFVVCSDDKFLKQLPNSKGMTFFGQQEKDGFSLTLERGSLSLNHLDESFIIQNSSIKESFNLSNLACCFLLSIKIYPNHKEALVKAAESFKMPANNRSQWIKVNSKIFFLDAYNANPSSMEASLCSFCENIDSLDETLFILGDMNELGEHAEKLHTHIGKLLSDLSIKNAWFVGRYADYYQKGFRVEAKHFSSVDEALKVWEKAESSFSSFFLKGSRTLQLEKLVDTISRTH